MLFIVALFVGAATLIYRWFEPLFTGTKPSSSSVQPTVQQLVAKFEFDTANPLFSSPISVEAGKKYRVEVDPHPEPGVTDPKAPWFDRLSPASPDGVLKPDSFVFRFGNFAKRAPAEPWFKVMASIGPDDQELIPVGSGRDITPKTSGRLFLFVNDVPCFYGNNHGKATVTVAQVQ